MKEQRHKIKSKGKHVCVLNFPILYLNRGSVVDHISGVSESLRFGTILPHICLMLREFISLRGEGVNKQEVGGDQVSKPGGGGQVPGGGVWMAGNAE